MSYMNTPWRDAAKQLPPEHVDGDAPEKYLIMTTLYGAQLALFHEGRFYQNLAAPFESVTHWMPIPYLP